MNTIYKAGTKERINELFGKIAKTKINESTDDERYENVVFMQGEDAYEPLEILNQNGEDAALDYLEQWHDPGNHEGTNELGHGSSDRIYEKDGYIMSYNTSLGYIGLQYDFQANEMKENEDEPNDTSFVEPNMDIEQSKDDALDNEQELDGGLADDSQIDDFDPEQIVKGLRVELEHTNDPKIAVEIAMDHLKENPNYYDELEDLGLADSDTEMDGSDSVGDDTDSNDWFDEYQPKSLRELDAPLVDPEQGEDEFQQTNDVKFQEELNYHSKLLYDLYQSNRIEKIRLYLEKLQDVPFVNIKDTSEINNGLGLDVFEELGMLQWKRNGDNIWIQNNTEKTFHEIDIEGNVVGTIKPNDRTELN